MCKRFTPNSNPISPSPPCKRYSIFCTRRVACSARSRDALMSIVPRISKESVLGQAVRDLVRRMFAGSTEDLVMSLVKTRQIDPATLTRLSQRIAASEESEPR